MVSLWIATDCPSITTVTVTAAANGVFEWSVEEYSGVGAIGQAIWNCGGTGVACTASANPKITLTTADNNNWLLVVTGSLGNDGIPTAGTGCGTTSGNLRDAGRTGTTSSHVALGFCDNTLATAGSLSEQDTITSSAWAAVGVELRAAAPSGPYIKGALGTDQAVQTTSGAATSTVVSDNVGSSCGGTTADAKCIQYWSFDDAGDLPNAVTLGNLFTQICAWGATDTGFPANLLSSWSGQGNLGIGSTAGHTYDATNNQGLAMIYVANTSSKATFAPCGEGTGDSAPVTPTDNLAGEFTNCKCTGALDVVNTTGATTVASGASNASGSPLTTAAGTQPTADGDLIIACAERTDAATTAMVNASFSDGTIAFIPARWNAARTTSVFCSFGIQATHGDITPKWSVTAGTYIFFTIAFKKNTGAACTGNIGTNGISLNSRQMKGGATGAVLAASGSPNTIHALYGNLTVVSWFGAIGTGSGVTAITDSKSNTYNAVTCAGCTPAMTARGSGTTNIGMADNTGVGGGDEFGFSYSLAPTAGATSITATYGAGVVASMVVYDFSGMASSNVVDTVCTADGQQTNAVTLHTALPNLTGPSCTPSNAYDWAIVNMPVDTNCVIGTDATSGFNPNYGPADQNNGVADIGVTSTATVTPVWDAWACESATTGLNFWGNAMVFFKSATAPPASSGHSLMLTGAGPS